jgi:hypothetical protein
MSFDRVRITPPQSTAHAAHCGLVLHRRAYLFLRFPSSFSSHSLTCCICSQTQYSSVPYPFAYFWRKGGNRNLLFRHRFKAIVLLLRRMEWRKARWSSGYIHSASPSIE